MYWPPVEWFTEKFPGRSTTDMADTYQTFWLSYESAFETILTAWDEVKGSGFDTITCMSCALRSS